MEGSAGTVVESEVRAPHPVLAPHVERYVGYRLDGFPPGLHWGLPSRYLTFIVSIGTPIDVAVQTDPHQPPDRYDVVVSGLQVGAARIAHDGYQEGVAIDLTPLGARTLLGVPAAAMWNTSLELGDAVGASAARELHERVRAAVGWDARFDACDLVLRRLAERHARAEVAPELVRAWRVLTERSGNAAISELAADVGWTRQHLARRFGDELGLSPKLAGRLIRFDRAQRLLRARPPFVTIAQVAATCGYYDQAHLDREFRDLAGAPPSEVLRDDLPSVQDADTGEGAGSLT